MLELLDVGVRSNGSLKRKRNIPLNHHRQKIFTMFVYRVNLCYVRCIIRLVIIGGMLCSWSLMNSFWNNNWLPVDCLNIVHGFNHLSVQKIDHCSQVKRYGPYFLPQKYGPSHHQNRAVYSHISRRPEMTPHTRLYTVKNGRIRLYFNDPGRNIRYVYGRISL